MRDEINKLKQNKVGNEEYEVSNFNINERLDMLEKKSNDVVHTDNASTAINPSTLSNNGGSAIDEAALADIVNKLANLQKDS